MSKVYEIDLPDDYLHILNCVVEYKVNKTFKCYNAGDTVHFGAKRLTADMFSQIINNYYMRPQYKNPYFYINNVTTDTLLPTNDTRSAVEADGIKYILSNISNADGTEAIIISIDGVTKTYVIPTLASTLVASILVDYPDLKIEIVSNSIIFYVYISNNYTNSIEIVNGNYTDLSGTSVAISIGANRVAKVNYGNASKVRLEIRYGKDNTLFELNQVYVDYLKSPQFIRLTQEQVDEVEDNSQMLEFPDYVCQEITNELIKLLMENASDPRLQTNIPINQSIASPAQEQQKR